MKNILFLAEELRYGGAESYFLSIENNIDRDYFSFYLMAVNGELYKRLKYPEYYYEYSFSQIDRYRKAKKICKLNNIDVIHVNSLRLAFVATFLRNKSRKVIYTKHNVTELEKISRKIYAFYLNHGLDIINVISMSERDYMISIGVNPDKVRVIYNGIDIKAYIGNQSYKKSDIIKCCMLARLSPEKNHKLFIDIASKIINNNSNVRFYIAGDGPERNNIKEYIEEKQLDDYFVMPGFVDSSNFLKNMNYLFIVSNREVLPMSIIEAMASGVIVISRDIGAVNEMIDENNGYLIRSKDAIDYAKVFNYSITSDETERIISAQKTAIKKFSLDVMINKIQKMYLEKS